MRGDGERAKKMQRALKAAGCRISSQRSAIIEHLASSKAHPSARRIFQEVQRKHPDLSLATVYNTLGVLTRLGQIKVMQFDALDNRYEPDVSPHINLICTSCGSIEDLRQSVAVRTDGILEESGFEVFDSRLEYYGLCAKCKSVRKYEAVKE